MSEKAAEQALYAAEAAMPIQEKLASDAAALASRWDELLTAQPGVDEFKALVANTREFLRLVPGQARATNAQLTEIMLAQGFQDLTGQVIGKVSDIVLELEGELAALLAGSAGRAKSDPAGAPMQRAHADRAGRNELVAGQRQVDELLESLAS
jgi:chemotaxis protein CheZ